MLAAALAQARRLLTTLRVSANSGTGYVVSSVDALPVLDRGLKAPPGG